MSINFRVANERMDLLPHEILVHICQFLPLSSRKRVRRVNKSWDSAACDPFIIKRELFYIHHLYLPFMTEVFSTLIKSQRSIINLKFFNLIDGDGNLPGVEKTLFSEDGVSSHFWLHYGTKVKHLDLSLSDVNCSDEILVKILKCCPNLTEFHCGGVYDTFDDPLEMLLNENMIFEKVTFLELSQVSCHDNRLYGVLRKLFPAVQNVKISFSTHFTTDEELEYVTAVVQAADYILTLSSRLQYAELCTDSDEWLVQEKVEKILASVTQIKTLRLTEMYLTPTHENILRLRNLKNLTTLCFDAEESKLSVCAILMELLKNLPNLRHLEMTKARKFGQNNNDVMEKLIASSLQTLIITKTRLNVGDNITMNECTCHNDTLETLRLDFLEDGAPESIYLFFIKYFRKLRRLSIEDKELSRNILDNLRVHQKNLNALMVTIKTNNHVTSFDVQHQLFSLRQFEYLERLKLVIISPLKERYSFFNFVMPQLKSLIIEFDMAPGDRCHVDFLNFANLFLAIGNMPKLEFLRLFNISAKVPLNLILRLCESLKNLEHLFISEYKESATQNAEISEQIYRSSFLELCNLFQVCKSLRFLLLEHSLAKNIISKEIVYDNITEHDSLNEKFCVDAGFSVPIC